MFSNKFLKVLMMRKIWQSVFLKVKGVFVRKEVVQEIQHPIPDSFWPGGFSSDLLKSKQEQMLRREEWRAAKNWIMSDFLRDDFQRSGWIVEDWNDEQIPGTHFAWMGRHLIVQIFTKHSSITWEGVLTVNPNPILHRANHPDVAKLQQVEVEQLAEPVPGEQ